MSEPFAAAVLAGGKSLRMGRDKAFLHHPLDGLPLWARQAGLVRSLGACPIYLSHNSQQSFPSVSDLTCVLDTTPGLGPLGGILSVLELCPHSLLLVLGVDLAAMPPEPLRLLLSVSTTGKGALFDRQGTLEPLAAVYPREILPLTRDRIRNRQLALRDWVDAAIQAGLLSLIALPPVWTPAFSNTNRPEDLAALSGSLS